MLISLPLTFLLTVLPCTHKLIPSQFPPQKDGFKLVESVKGRHSGRSLGAITRPATKSSNQPSCPRQGGYRVHTSQSRLRKGFDRGINCGQPDPHSRRTDRRNRIWRPSVGKKGAALYEAVRQHQSVNIRQLSRNRAEQVGYYRFLENENVTISELVRSLSAHCQQQVEGRHVLAISDSSEINLQSHALRLKPEELGVVGNNTDVGFYIHPTLVLDGESGIPLGLSTVQLWSRSLARL